MGQFIVLDLEWNQSPAGKEGSMNRLPFEIIEIGAVKLNKNLQIISEFRRLIRPRVYRQMHYKISEVTHMSIEQLDTEGEDFVRAMTEFLEWCGDDYRFCTWGSMDLTELQRNMSVNAPLALRTIVVRLLSLHAFACIGRTSAPFGHVCSRCVQTYAETALSYHPRGTPFS